MTLCMRIIQTKSCLMCGVVFQKKPSHSQKAWKERTKFCSRSCADQFKKGKAISWLEKHQFKKGEKVWNKGLTKKKAPGLMKLSLERRGDNNVMKRKEVRKKSGESRKGSTHAQQHRDNIALGIKKYWDKKGRRGYQRPKNSVKYKTWRRAIFERDDYTCQECGERGCKIVAHHIKGWAKYPKLRYEISNGIVLCTKCHKLTDNYGRKGS